MMMTKMMMAAIITVHSLLAEKVTCLKNIKFSADIYFWSCGWKKNEWKSERKNGKEKLWRTLQRFHFLRKKMFWCCPGRGGSVGRASFKMSLKGLQLYRCGFESRLLHKVGGKIKGLVASPSVRRTWMYVHGLRIMVDKKRFGCLTAIGCHPWNLRQYQRWPLSVDEKKEEEKKAQHNLTTHF